MSIATKSQILENKSAEELKEMAEAKNLYGYSEMNMSELAKLIEANYSEEEIGSQHKPMKPKRKAEGEVETVEFSETDGGIEQISKRRKDDTAGIEKIETVEQSFENNPEPEKEKKEDPLKKIAIGLTFLLIIITSLTAYLALTGAS